MTFSQTATAIMILGLPRASKSIDTKSTFYSNFLQLQNPKCPCCVPVLHWGSQPWLSTAACLKLLACRLKTMAVSIMNLPLNLVISKFTLSGKNPFLRDFCVYACSLAQNSKASVVQHQGKSLSLLLMESTLLFKERDNGAF